MDGRAGVRQRFTALEPVLDEKSRRLLVAAESKAWGLGGISVVCKATGVSRQVIRQGLRELEEAPTHPAGRIRRAGGGRKRAKQKVKICLTHQATCLIIDSWQPNLRLF